ncbi:MAG: ribosome biogenesis GTPase YlqF [Mycoplasmatota bacterium]
MDMYQKRKLRKEKKENVVVDKIEERKTNINWYPGHMAKTKRLISEMRDLIDVVYEVVDARIPYSSKLKEIDELIYNKPKIIVMTKMDLCDKYETKKWMNYYEKQGSKVIGVDLENNFNMNGLINLTKELMNERNEKRTNKGLSIRKTRVLIIGVPNAGKSTLINRLVGKKTVNTGNKPGVTKSLSWIRISSDLELLDSPGILWPKLDEGNIGFNLASFTAIKEEILPLDHVAAYILKNLSLYYPNILKERFGIEEYDEEEIIEAYDIIGKKRGCLIKGGEVDYDKVINIIINDVKNGAIKNITFDRFLND